MLFVSFALAGVPPGGGTPSLVPHSAIPDEMTRMEPDTHFGAHAGWFASERCAAHHAPLNLTFMLHHSTTQITRLRNHLLTVSNPKSPSYGQYLTRDQLTQLVQVPKAVDAVREHLIASGVPDSAISTGVQQDSVTVRALPCMHAERLFATTIHQYSHVEKKRNVMRASSGYHLPRSLAPHVALVAPLVRLPKTRKPQLSEIKRASKGMAPEPTSISDSGASESVSSWPMDCGYSCHDAEYVTPRVLAQQYSLGDAPGHDALGSMAVASFQGEFWDQPGLNDYSSTCGMPPIKVAHQVGNDIPFACAGGEACAEGMMDVELIKAVGGGVPLTVVYNGEYSLEKWALQLGEMNDLELPLVHSVSYGDDEVEQFLDAPKGTTGAAYMDRVDTEFMKLGLRGTTIIFASGDQGTWGRTGVRSGSKFHADYPASSPWVTAVGGTDLRVAGAIGEGEQAWDAGGGGFATHARMPDYQSHAVSTYLRRPEYLPPSSLYNASGRGYPDVSMLGGVQNAYCIAPRPASWYGIGGTSASAPAFAGVVAKLNNERLRAGKAPMGFINPFLYANPQAFNDVIFGENKDTGYVGFRATRGWDAATGLGTPNYVKLHRAAMTEIR